MLELLVTWGTSRKLESDPGTTQRLSMTVGTEKADSHGE